MLKFSEELLHFIWRHKLLKPTELFTTTGESISIINPGTLNVDAGPDFFNGQIKIGGVVLVGNIEIHIRTSDWLRHHHQEDKSYDHIILHVVYEHDIDLPQNLNNNVPVLEIRKLIDDRTLTGYSDLAEAPYKLPCSKQLKVVDDLKFISWMERMTVERLQNKFLRIEQYFKSCNGDFTQTLYTLLIRNFGFKVNAEPFEQLAARLPATLILKHSENRLQLEALFLGIAGFLDEQLSDPYLQKLQNEFEFLHRKYKLVLLEKKIFKFSKMRPANFPNLRLVQFAALINKSPRLLTAPHEFTSHQLLIDALQVSTEGYWQHHYKIDGNKLDFEVTFGEGSIENLIINTFAPFFFFYGKKTGKGNFSDLSLHLLGACKSELNFKTKLFADKKNLLKNSAGTQAVINLFDNYCQPKLCLKCGVAAAILQPKAILQKN